MNLINYQQIHIKVLKNTYYETDIKLLKLYLNFLLYSNLLNIIFSFFYQMATLMQ
jgi:hypothetical protein